MKRRTSIDTKLAKRAHVGANNSQKVTEQGEITANVDFPFEEYAQRSESSVLYKKGRQCYPDGGVKENHSISQFDILVGWKRGGSKSSVASGVVGEPVFATLNGIDHSPYKTARDLAKNMYFAGISKSTMKAFDTDEMTGSGLAARKYGTATIPLASIHEFRPADKVVMYLPPFDRPERFNASKLTIFNGGPPTRLTPLIKPFDIHDVHEFGTSIVAEVLNNERIGNTPICDLISNSSPWTKDVDADSSIDYKRRAAVHLKHSVLTVVQSAVSILLDRGLLEYVKQAGEEDEDEEDAQKRTRFLKDELSVAQLLGFAHADRENELDQFADIQNDVLKSSFYSELSGSLHPRYGPLDCGLPEPLDDPVPSPDTVATYVETMMAGPHALRCVFSTLLHDISEHVIGTSLNSAHPGQTDGLDIMIGGHLYGF